MLRFELFDGGIVTVDPKSVESVVETEVVPGGYKSLLSGNVTKELGATINTISGFFNVKDPNRTVSRQIEEAKKNG